MARAPKKKASARSKTSSSRAGKRAATKSAKTAKRAKQTRGSTSAAKKAAKRKPAAAKKKPVPPKKKPAAAKKKPVPPKKKPVPPKKKPAAAKKSPPKRPAPKAPPKAARAAPPKIAPAEPAPQEKVKKKAKPEVTPREIRRIKAALEQQRTTLTREFTVLQEDSFATQSDAGGEAGFDEEFADAGSFTFEREKDLSIGQNIRDLVDKVEHALAAIEARTYGICENCGNPISKARLLALPYSTLCLTCKQQEERTR